MNARQTIAGHVIELEAGKRYLAARPMATKGASRFVISIYEHKDFHSQSQPTAIVNLQPMPYDEANQFLAAFNNGKTTFEGRLWA